MKKRILFPIELTQSNIYKRDYLISKFNKYCNLKKSKILEIGIGNGRFGFLLGDKFKEYDGIDIDKEYVEIAKTNIPKGAKIEYKLGNAENIPFEGKFNILFYAQSWHFIKDFKKALEEAKRILEEEGIIVIIEPSEKTTNWADPRLRKDSQEFDSKQYAKKIEDLKKGEKVIREQKAFNIIEFEYDPNTTFNFYVLKRKDILIPNLLP